jgi:hypothetical protein
MVIISPAADAEPLSPAGKIADAATTWGKISGRPNTATK